MNSNQQFSVSCHILAILAISPEAAVTSETISLSVDTNPVVIRRIMAHLRQHGLVESRSGANGGWRLTRPASMLSLREVYQAVSPKQEPGLFHHETVLALHQHPNPDCLIGGHIQEALGSVFNEAQMAMEQALDRFTVADVLAETLHRAEPGTIHRAEPGTIHRAEPGTIHRAEPGTMRANPQGIPQAIPQSVPENMDLALRPGRNHQ